MPPLPYHYQNQGFDNHAHGYPTVVNTNTNTLQIHPCLSPFTTRGTGTIAESPLPQLADTCASTSFACMH
ncbi:hypothetical protein BDV23DRAFT_143495 [Aspergillus alliaceus]|uniref:Uncharacterized protein n=1 Tax=Petromyces alliaceus TaxID=209559 RepID=A0A5N7CS35_PETAA|nr:hypothetical protein BDV23DRAFT_143495 [Aspergillus alliaceus]